MPQHAGGCLCGQIRFVATADPRRINVCHCHFCQRNTGTAYLVEPVFPREAFVITSGTPKVYSSVSHGSGKKVGLHFCGDCGGRIYMTFERFPEVIGAFSGAFDDPNAFTMIPGVARHLFTASAQHGTVLPSDVPLFTEHAIREDGSLREPTILPEPIMVGSRQER